MVAATKFLNAAVSVEVYCTIGTQDILFVSVANIVNY